MVDNPQEQAASNTSPSQETSGAPSPPSEPKPPTPAIETTALYLAKRLIADRGYAPKIPPEAAELARASDIVLTRADGMTFEVVCVLDCERDPARKFTLCQDALLAIGKACLKYTGTINSAKMPVSIRIVVVATTPYPAAEKIHLKALARHPGFAKVGISVWFLDASTVKVETTVLLNGLFAGRRYYEKLLREPRQKDAEIFRPAAAVGAENGRPWVTVSLVAVLVALFVLEIVGGVRPWKGPLAPDILSLVALGGLFKPLLVEDGEWHRVVTSAFLHADLFHLVMNGIALFMAGVVLESLLGRAWLLALFFLGAVGGSLLALAVNPDNVVSVGASGAIMGLFAAAMVSSFRLREGPARTQLQVPLLQVLVPSLIPIATTRAHGHINFAAHFGGAIMGAVVGGLLLRSWRENEALPRFRGLAGSVAILGLAATVVGFCLVGRDYSKYAAMAQSSPSSEEHR